MAHRAAEATAVTAGGYFKLVWSVSIEARDIAFLVADLWCGRGDG
jgi:hypothetical protein